MTGNFSVIFKKYSVPVLFLVTGLVILIIGLTMNQGPMFLTASILMFIAGAATLVYSSGKLNRNFLLAFGGLAFLAAICTFYSSYSSVASSVKAQKDFDRCLAISQQNLEDVRFVQKKHFEKTGKYLKTWEEISEFIKVGTINRPVSEGTVPARKITPEERDYLYDGNPPIDKNMTDEEALRLSKWLEGPNYQADFINFKRDTVPESIMDSKFKSASYRSNRKKANFGPFYPDSLCFIPYTGATQKWELAFNDSVQMGDAKVAAIKVFGKIPFVNPQSREGIEMFFGSTTSNSLAGSWENE
ncbi:MAG: hypothetical protein MK066_10655 [Crocinitomicaceae bacterium]|nr:hypothetical protein [Crocinitomicaceae bacterium]